MDSSFIKKLPAIDNLLGATLRNILILLRSQAFFGEFGFALKFISS